MGCAGGIRVMNLQHDGIITGSLGGRQSKEVARSMQEAASHAMGPLTQKKSSDPPLAMAVDRSLSSASPSSRAPHESPCLAMAGAGSSTTIHRLLPIRSARPRERFSDLLTMIGGTTNLFGVDLP